MEPIMGAGSGEKQPLGPVVQIDEGRISDVQAYNNLFRMFSVHLIRDLLAPRPGLMLALGGSSADRSSLSISNESASLMTA